jgi:hypothetical protein
MATAVRAIHQYPLDTPYTLNAMGQSTHCSRILNSFILRNILRKLLDFMELHEESAVELVYAKEYLRKVLTEMHITKKYL